MDERTYTITAVPGLWHGLLPLLQDPALRESVQLCAIGLAVHRATYGDLQAMIRAHGVNGAELFTGEIHETLPAPDHAHATIWARKVSAKLKKQVADFIASRGKAERERNERARLDEVARLNEEGFKLLMRRIKADADEAMKRMNRRYQEAKREVRKVVMSHAD